MIDLYTAVVFITIFILCITTAEVLTNRLIGYKMKKNSIIVCILIGISITCEWIGVKTNGGPEALILLHKFAKLIEFCLAPAIGITAAIAYGKVKRPDILIGIVAAHVVFECASMYYGFVFSVDEANIYHRESLYWVYIAVFSISTIYSFICIVNGGKEYQARIDSVLILSLCLLAAGIGIQMRYSEIRVDFMCVAVCNMMFYNHRCEKMFQVDMVTRLLNRRCYERTIENIKSPAYILIFDINNFKRINDTYGHVAGDRCLKLVARTIYDVYGKYGFCYRIGGDEFCVIMNKNLDNLEKLNRRFKDEIDKLRSADEKISDVALGYEYYDEADKPISKVVEAADEKMYKNKR